MLVEKRRESRLFHEQGTLGNLNPAPGSFTGEAIFFVLLYDDKLWKRGDILKEID
jgi:hypothetical protein